MPYINVKVTGGADAPTKEQKNEIIKGVSQVLYDVLGKHPKSTYVVIDEVELDNWGVGGESLTSINERKQGK